MTRILTGGLCALMLAAVANTDVAAAGAACEALSSLKLPDTTITLAHAVEAGTFAPPASGSAQAGRLTATLPAFCRVAATLKPSADSDIKVEVWLPASGWNGTKSALPNRRNMSCPARSN